MSDARLSEHQVLKLLRSRDALREGHFALSSGMHVDRHVHVERALRSHRVAKRLSVGLSREFRTVREVATALPACTVIAPPGAGIAVAFGVGEALDAQSVLWAEWGRGRLRFRPSLSPEPEERCIVVDCVVRTGQTLLETAELVRRSGARLLAAGVLVDQRVKPLDLGGPPLLSLARVHVDAQAPESCDACQRGVPLVPLERMQDIEAA